MCQGTIEKWIASGYEQPHAVITISAVESAPAETSAVVQELFQEPAEELIY